MPKLTSQRSRIPTLIEAYLGNDLNLIYEDALTRPEHYSKEQRSLLLDLQAKKTELYQVDYREANDLFFTFYRDTEVAKASEEALAAAKDKYTAYQDLDEIEEPRPFKPPVFEDGQPEDLEPGDKVIV